MSRTATPRPNEPNAKSEAAQKARDEGKERPKEGHRETVEAVAVAFILALLVRGFEAEAFVIPTGSMAPTLMGRHKEVVCPQCGYTFSVNASDESEGYSIDKESEARRVSAGICMNCRYEVSVRDLPSFKGDRILVMKFPYEMPFLPGSAGPRRWDVIVFHYPEEPEVSYIKRMVGLPGETLQIWNGNILVKPPGGNEFRLERRPLYHQQAMQMMVYDDAHRPTALADRPEWRRWGSPGDAGWAEDSLAPGTFRVEASPGDWTELRYRHLVPDPQQWQAVLRREAPPRPPRPTLITDFYSYNTNLSAGTEDLTVPSARASETAWLQPHWVGDLTLSATVQSESSQGMVRFDLVEGGVVNRCEIDLATGEATLSHGEATLGKAVTPLKGPGTHALAFANVDNRLTVWVDDRPVFGDGLTYEDAPSSPPAPTAEDLAPVRIAARGTKVGVSGLVLKRDIYYTQSPGALDYRPSWEVRMPSNPVELFDLLADPAKVASLGPLTASEYVLGGDRYMMLGDNSPRSKDSRGWHNEDIEWDTLNRQRHEVPRSMLTGKAFCVYWPHGKPFWPDIAVRGRDLRLPFRPYFERMGWIH
ncbi:MAG: S26 family signal peptidase [Isosphaeraceae bacterium]